ncbi:metallophosphoesterase family protein [Ferroplasma sp.]|uniref:metallophosphoesterase family protein n=1 Tax=Ferroplasma sp. TaxID=2591003 RepID=UPI00307F4C97
MKLMVISDAHGNFDALEAACNGEKYDKLIFLGDAVDYGPDPGQVLDFLKSNSDANIMGNHDNSVLTGSSCNCSFDMLELSDYTRENISMKLLGKNDLDFLKTFKLNMDIEIDGKRFYMAHASPYNNLDGYLFANEAEKVFRDKQFFDGHDYILIGHTHFMMLYRNKIINPGSVGQPRDFTGKPSYVIIDTDDSSIAFKRVKYNSEKMLEKLRPLMHDDILYNKLKKYYI